MQTVKTLKAHKLVNVYRVVYSLGGIRSTSGIHHNTVGEAYSEVEQLARNGFPNAVVELDQVRVLTTA